MFNNFLKLTDNQVKEIFDNCRNLGICGGFFFAARWELMQISLVDSMLNIFNAFVLVLLVLSGIFLFFINQMQAIRRLGQYSIDRNKILLIAQIYNLVAVTFIVSIFLR